MRITKVTTKTGDAGETGLGNGERVSKNSPRVHAMGSIDKLNSIIGWARTLTGEVTFDILGLVQQDLFNMGGEIAIPDVEMNLFFLVVMRYRQGYIFQEQNVEKQREI